MTTTSNPKKSKLPKGVEALLDLGFTEGELIEAFVTETELIDELTSLNEENI